MKPELVIIHAGTNDITSKTKTLENHKRMTDLFTSKFPSCKLVISNIFKRKDKNEIHKRVAK